MQNIAFEREFTDPSLTYTRQANSFSFKIFDMSFLEAGIGIYERKSSIIH